MTLNGGRIAGMDEPPELQYNGHWRMAVWALRVGYVGLAVAIAGIVVMSSGSTPWVLAAGVFIWLAAAAVTLTGFFRSRHELPEPRPGTGRCGSCSSTTRSTPGRRLSGPDRSSRRGRVRRGASSPDPL